MVAEPPRPLASFPPSACSVAPHQPQPQPDPLIRDIRRRHEYRPIDRPRHWSQPRARPPPRSPSCSAGAPPCTPGHATPTLSTCQAPRWYALDITDPASVASAVEIAGDVTLLINNAGSNTGTDLLNGDEAQIRVEMDTHFFGTLSVIRAFAPKISTNGGGSILNILSGLSWVSFPGIGAYCAAKSAEWSMTNALRVQLAEQNIRVAGLHVGYMDTDMTASITAPKSNPADIAKIAIDGVEQDLFEIVADDVSRQVQAALAGGVPALYPQVT